MTQTADLPIPPDQNPLAGEVNALWAKILDEEIIHGGPLTSSHIDEAKSVVLETLAHISEAIQRSVDPDLVITSVRQKIEVLLRLPKRSSFNPRILQHDLPLLRDGLRFTALKGVRVPKKIPEGLAIGSQIQLPNGVLTIQEIGELASSSFMIYRVFGVTKSEDGASEQTGTYVIKGGSMSDVKEHQRLQASGLPVFDLYHAIPGGVIMDDLDGNGQSVTLSMNCLEGALSWLHVRDHKFEGFTDFDDSWLERYFECALTASRAGRFIPGIAYFFNCRKEPRPNLKFLIGDYGELEGFKSGDTRDPLTERNFHQAYNVLESFLGRVLQKPQLYLDRLSQFFYKGIIPNGYTLPKGTRPD